MFREIIFTSHVHIPVSNQENNRKIRASVVVNKLLTQISNIKALKCGYLIAVTKLITIGDAETRFLPHSVVFPVEFQCSTFIPVRGEIMNGIVCKVFGMGALLKCGPMNMVYLSVRKMPGYVHVSGENVYLKEDMSRIDVGVVVRFVVFAVRWENNDIRREFSVLASIDGAGLGPVSLTGVDEIDMIEFQE